MPEPPARNARRLRREGAEETDSNAGKSIRGTSDQTVGIKRPRATLSLDTGPELRRRNSDPTSIALQVASPASLQQIPPPYDESKEFIGCTANGVFKIAGHRY